MDADRTGSKTSVGPATAGLAASQGSGFDLFSAYKAKYYTGKDYALVDSVAKQEQRFSASDGFVMDKEKVEESWVTQGKKNLLTPLMLDLSTAPAAESNAILASSPLYTGRKYDQNKNEFQNISPLSRKINSNIGSVVKPDLAAKDLNFATSTPAAARLKIKATDDDLLLNPTSFLESTVKKLPNGFTDGVYNKDVDFSTPIVSKVSNKLLDDINDPVNDNPNQITSLSTRSVRFSSNAFEEKLREPAPLMLSLNQKEEDMKSKSEQSNLKKDIPIKTFSSGLENLKLKYSTSTFTRKENINQNIESIRSPITSKVSDVLEYSRKRAIPSPNVAGFEPSRMKYYEYNKGGSGDIPRKPNMYSYVEVNNNKQQFNPIEKDKYLSKQQDNTKNINIETNFTPVIIPREIYAIQEKLIMSDLIDSLLGFECTFFLETKNVGNIKLYGILEEYLDTIEHPTDKVSSGSDYRDYPLDSSLKEAVINILNLANDHSFISTFITQLDDSFKYPNCRQALNAKIHDLLSSFRKKVLQIETKLNDKYDMKSTAIDFNIQSFWLELQPVIPTIQTIHLLIDSIVKFEEIYSKYKSSTFILKGGQLLSVISIILQKHIGDPVSRQIYESILSATSVPFIRTLLKWVHVGELHDPHQEFFVKVDENISQNKVSDDFLDEYWERKYSLRSSMVPIFFRVVGSDFTDDPEYRMLTQFLNMVSSIRKKALSSNINNKNSENVVKKPMGIMETLGLEPMENNMNFGKDLGYDENQFSIKNFDDLVEVGYKKVDMNEHQNGTDKAFNDDYSSTYSSDLAVEILNCGKFLNVMLSRDPELSVFTYSAKNKDISMLDKRARITDDDYSFMNRIKSVLLSELTEKQREIIQSLNTSRCSTYLKILKEKYFESNSYYSKGTKGVPKSILIEDVDPHSIQKQINEIVDVMNEAGTNINQYNHVELVLSEDALFNQPISNIFRLIGGGNLIREIKISHKFANQMLLTELFLSQFLVERLKLFRDFFLLGNSEYIVNFLDYTTTSVIQEDKDKSVDTFNDNYYIGGNIRRRYKGIEIPLLEQKAKDIDIHLLENKLELAILKSSKCIATTQYIKPTRVYQINEEEVFMDTEESNMETDVIQAAGISTSKPTNHKERFNINSKKLADDKILGSKPETKVSKYLSTVNNNSLLLNELMSSLKCELSDMTLKEQLLRITGISTEHSQKDLKSSSYYYTYLGDSDEEEQEEKEEVQDLSSFVDAEDGNNMDTLDNNRTTPVKQKKLSGDRIKDLAMSVHKSVKKRTKSDNLRKKEHPLIDGSEFLTILHYRKIRQNKSKENKMESTEIEKSLDGLEAFTLSLELKFPVSLIFNKRTLLKYQLLFRHLFQCKYLEQDLGRNYLLQTSLQSELERIRTIQLSERITAVKTDRKNMTFDEKQTYDRLKNAAEIMIERRGFGKALSESDYFVWVDKVVSLMGIIRFKILHFIRRFQYFISFEVIENEFNKFITDLESINFVDEVLKLHDKFLDKCLKGTMLTNPDLVKILTGVFDQTKEFIGIVDEFVKERYTEVSTTDENINRFYSNLLKAMQSNDDLAYKQILENKVIDIAKTFDKLSDFDQILTLGISELVQKEQFYSTF